MIYTRGTALYEFLNLKLHRMRFSLSGDLENNLQEMQQQQMSKEFNCKSFILWIHDSFFLMNNIKLS